MANQTEKKTINIGPGAIATASVEGGPAFTLSSTEWIAIQNYVLEGQSLPINETDFRAFLGKGAPEDLSDFIQLIKAYGDINAHVTKWQEDTFPQSVSLASDIVAYANLAPTYYNPILPLAEALTKNPDDVDARNKLTAILDVLIKNAEEYHANAKIVSEKIQEFGEETRQDKIVMTGTDGTGGLKKYYEDEYGETSEEVIRLNKEIEAQRVILDAANADYDHNNVIASTTPAYGWIWPVGTVAGAVVAGVYGDKAAKALDRARAAQEEIDSLTDDLAANANLMTTINRAQVGITNIIEPISNALPSIQKIQGVWGAIADDLFNIKQLIETNIAQALPIIMDLGVESAINAWAEVGKIAEAYRLNAYITVTDVAA